MKQDLVGWWACPGALLGSLSSNNKVHYIFAKDTSGLDVTTVIGPGSLSLGITGRSVLIHRKRSIAADMRGYWKKIARIRR